VVNGAPTSGAMHPRHACDVIVLGAGVGGMTVAAMCAADGLQVLLLESSPLLGGTTAISGGMAWMPANTKMSAAGLRDTIAEAELYLASTVPAGNDRLRAAFVANADHAVTALEAKTSVRFRPVVKYPDYYPDRPGATMGGRVLEPVPFDGRELGRHFRCLRPPLAEFTLFGGMMLDRADIPHFRKAGRSLRSAARVARLMARHARERLFERRGTSLYLGNALAARLLHSLLRPNVEIRRGTRVGELLVDNGRVTGVVIDSGETREVIRADRAVVLATGGFSHEPRMRADYLPARAGAYSSACASSKGEGIRLALAAGAVMRPQPTNNAFWVPVSVARGKDGRDRIFPHTVTDRAKPGAIVVDQAARRYVNEAVSYHEFVQAMFRADEAGRAIPSFMICDSRFLWKYGLGAVKPFTIAPGGHLRSGYLKRGRTIEELATRLGLPAEALAETVSSYNQHAAHGADPAFARGSDPYQRHLGDAEHGPNPCVAPIDKAPFYAVALHPGDLGTAAGLLTNEHGQVLDASGAWIANLYACGNDMSSVMNGAYPGPGITIGPALTFGVLVAEHIAGASLNGGHRPQSLRRQGSLR
jgi:succinate dehydrogenase/fumarate reductase flavoprotein subunit